MILSPVVAWELDCLLGEGPVWLDREQALRFVDIKRGQLHRFDPATRRGETAAVGGKPSFIVPSEDGDLLVGSGHGIYRSSGAGLGELLFEIEQPAGNRVNDVTVDEQGRLWFGTMDDSEVQVTGAIWCYDRGTLGCAEPNAVVTNGPAVSNDDRWIYHVDSGERLIYRAPLGAPGILSGSKPFIALPEEVGFPDGIVVDSEDCLWVALWDGWGVRRYDPNGQCMLHVPFPCARVTKVAFGGADLKTAFVTTARIGLTDAELADQPLAGSLFAFNAPVAGRPLPPVALPTRT